MTRAGALNSREKKRPLDILCSIHARAEGEHSGPICHYGQKHERVGRFQKQNLGCLSLNLKILLQYLSEIKVQRGNSKQVTNLHFIKFISTAGMYHLTTLNMTLNMTKANTSKMTRTASQAADRERELFEWNNFPIAKPYIRLTEVPNLGRPWILNYPLVNPTSTKRKFTVYQTLSRIGHGQLASLLTLTRSTQT